MKLKKRLAALAATAVLAAAFCAPALALLSPTADFYVNDSAGVLDEATERQIVEQNDGLYAACGAQIVVVTVNDTEGLGTAEYAYQLGNEWGIGSSSENNGVLLLLSIGEQDYQCIQGSGLEDSLSTMTLSRILQEDLEPDFAAGDYDAGVQKTFDTLYRQVCAIYGLDPSNPAANVAPGAGYEQPASSGLFGLGLAALVLPLGALVLVLMVLSLLRPVRVGRYPRYGRPYVPHRHIYRRPGPPPPPPGPWGGSMLGGSVRRPPRPGGGSFRMGGGGSFRSGGGFRGGGGGGFRGGGAGRGH
ncbi:hypothetical protein Ruko_16630 [Ruthenibacterium sp. TH_2024_36131]|uniref:TPM domain-containing protein n=1 Tax=Owariibacterium komagatae TaxID=3136601 RepID=UPI0038B39612